MRENRQTRSSIGARSSAQMLGSGLLALIPAFTTAEASHASPSGGGEAAACRALATLVIPETTILSAESITTSPGSRGTPYCLVKLVVSPAIDIWVGLPTATHWNHRFLALGGGGYAGEVAAPIDAVLAGYAGAMTDGGHAGSALDGSFALDPSGELNDELIVDFASRAVHEMALKSKILIAAYYGDSPAYSYMSGHSFGGLQGLMESQRFPDDFDGILAGAPAINWDRVQPSLLWPQVVMKDSAGGPISAAKLILATAAATAACDALDGVVDGVLTDPRACQYSATALVADPCADPSSRPPQNAPRRQSAKCLTPGEASAIDEIWRGPRDARGCFQWFGLTRDAGLDRLAGATPFPIATDFFRYWIHQDPSFDWRTVTESSFPTDFAASRAKFNAVLGADDPDLASFRDRGGKLLIWHGFADDIVPPEGSIDYYDRLSEAMGGLAATQQFARLFMAPGVLHSSAGAGLEPVDAFGALVHWVEGGVAPDQLLAADAVRSRPLCPYPQQAVYVGTGNTDDAANFACAVAPVVPENVQCD